MSVRDSALFSFLADDLALRVAVGDVAPRDEPPPRGAPAQQRAQRGKARKRRNNEREVVKMYVKKCSKSHLDKDCQRKSPRLARVI